MSRPAAPRISVIAPAYDEEANLAPFVEELAGVMERHGQPWELVVVDDGSRDATPARLAALRQRFPALRTLRLRRHAGQSAAFAAGFDAARGEILVTIDADLQNDPADIPRLLRALEGADVACGIRRRRRDSLLRRLASRVANAVRRAVIHDGVTDTGCSLKAFPREAALRLPRFDGMHRFFPALLQWQGCRVVELEVNHRPRRAGRSKYDVRGRLFRTAADLLGVRWMRSRHLDDEVDR